MNRSVVLYSIAAGICLAVALYALLGALQGVFVFSGERQVRNLAFWFPLALVFGGFGLAFGYLGLRSSLLGLKGKNPRGPR